MKTKKSIVEWDIDEATYVGDGDNGVYYQVGAKTRGKDKGWYVTCVVDSDTGAFVDTLVTDDGPYDSEEEAIIGGKNCAYEWCINNDVNWEDNTPLNVFSELMFNIQYSFGMAEFDKLMAKPEFARFMTLEEDDLTPELKQDLAEKIDYLQWGWKPELTQAKG